MIKVYLETKESHVHFKSVDRVRVNDDKIIIDIGNTPYCWLLDDLLTYEIRKDNINV